MVHVYWYGRRRVDGLVCVSFARPTVWRSWCCLLQRAIAASSRPRGCNRPAGTVLRCTNERLDHAGKLSPKTLNLDVCRCGDWPC